MIRYCKTIFKAECFLKLFKFFLVFFFSFFFHRTEDSQRTEAGALPKAIQSWKIILDQIWLQFLYFIQNRLHFGNPAFVIQKC